MMDIDTLKLHKKSTLPKAQPKWPTILGRYNSIFDPFPSVAVVCVRERERERDLSFRSNPFRLSGKARKRSKTPLCIRSIFPVSRYKSLNPQCVCVYHCKWRSTTRTATATAKKNTYPSTSLAEIRTQSCRGKSFTAIKKRFSNILSVPAHTFPGACSTPIHSSYKGPSLRVVVPFPGVVVCWRYVRYVMLLNCPFNLNNNIHKKKIHRQRTVEYFNRIRQHPFGRWTMRPFPGVCRDSLILLYSPKQSKIEEQPNNPSCKQEQSEPNKKTHPAYIPLGGFLPKWQIQTPIRAKCFWDRFRAGILHLFIHSFLPFTTTNTKPPHGQKTVLIDWQNINGRDVFPLHVCKTREMNIFRLRSLMQNRTSNRMADKLSLQPYFFTTSSFFGSKRRFDFGVIFVPEGESNCSYMYTHTHIVNLPTCIHHISESFSALR